MKRRPEEIQAEYYQRTAAVYDELHVADDDPHSISLRYVSSYVELLSVTSILDVGCGTGRGIEYFRLHHPEVKVMGVEPVPSMIDLAVAEHGIPRELIVPGRGENLPFEDGAFDAVCEFGMLHHVRRPDAVLTEMMRVAKKVIFINDSNRFGQGRPMARKLKLALYKCGLWPALNYLKTRGRGYTLSDGDGLAYSYSVYDSYRQIADWADQISLIATSGEKPASWLHPLLSSSNVLVVAAKNGIHGLFDARP